MQGQGETENGEGSDDSGNDSDDDGVNGCYSSHTDIERIGALNCKAIKIIACAV